MRAFGISLPNPTTGPTLAPVQSFRSIPKRIATARGVTQDRESLAHRRSAPKIIGLGYINPRDVPALTGKIETERPRGQGDMRSRTGLEVIRAEHVRGKARRTGRRATQL
jgi:hypothetical protein